MVTRELGYATALAMDGYPGDVSSIIDMAQQARATKDFASVRTLACFSGEGGKDSLIYKISKKMGIPVKGYKSEVYSGVHEGFFESHEVEAVKSRILAAGNQIGRIRRLQPHGNEIYGDMASSVIAGAEYFDI